MQYLELFFTRFHVWTSKLFFVYDPHFRHWYILFLLLSVTFSSAPAARRQTAGIGSGGGGGSVFGSRGALSPRVPASAARDDEDEDEEVRNCRPQKYVPSGAL